MEKKVSLRVAARCLGTGVVLYRLTGANGATCSPLKNLSPLFLPYCLGACYSCPDPACIFSLPLPLALPDFNLWKPFLYHEQNWRLPILSLPHRPSSLLSTHTHPYPPERPQKKAPRINKIGTQGICFTQGTQVFSAPEIKGRHRTHLYSLLNFQFLQNAMLWAGIGALTITQSHE